MIIKVIRLGTIGAAIQLCALLAFIGTIRTTFAVPGKDIAIIIFFVAIIGLLIAAVRQLAFKELCFLAVFLSVSSTAIYQVLGFSFFPGLVKDITLLSPEHLLGIVVLASILFGAHMGGFFLVWTIIKLFKI